MAKGTKKRGTPRVNVPIGWSRCPVREQTVSVELCFRYQMVDKVRECVKCKYDWDKRVPDNGWQKCWRCGKLIVLAQSSKCPVCRKRIK